MIDTQHETCARLPQVRDFFENLGNRVDSAVDSHNFELTGFFAGLRPVVRVARQTQAQLDRFAATRFSIFRYFNSGELDLSRIFADLLDPAGAHGQGDRFLRVFLEQFQELAFEFPTSGPLKCGVHLEFPTRTGTARRRIDIVLQMPDDLWIGIENKPFADDEEAQIADYLEDLESRGQSWMLYFSGNGRDPSEKSLGHLASLTPRRWLTVPYRDETVEQHSIEAWIHQCREKCEAERVRWFLMDLLEYVRKSF